MSGQDSKYFEAIAAAKGEMDRLKKSLKQTKKELADTTLENEAENVPSLSKTVFKARRTLRGHLSKIFSMNWCSSKPYLVSASQDGKLIIWNGISGAKFSAATLQSPWVMTCAYSPSGNLVAAGGLDNKCSVYEVKRYDSVLKNELSHHSAYVSCARFVNDEQLVTCSGDATCILWDIENSKPLVRFKDHDADVMCASLNVQHQVFVSGACDAMAKAWDMRTGRCVQTFAGHESDINAIKFFPDFYAFATGSDDGSCRLFDLRYDGEVNVYTHESFAGGVTSIDFSLSGRILFASYDDCQCAAWDVLRAERISTLSSHQNRVSCLGVSADGYALCTGSWDANLKLWTL